MFDFTKIGQIGEQLEASFGELTTGLASIVAQNEKIIEQNETTNSLLNQLIVQGQWPIKLPEPGQWPIKLPEPTDVPNS